MSPKMHNKHAFSAGVLYSGMYDVLFHNIKSYLNLKTHNIFLRFCFMTKFENCSDLNDNYKYNHISIRM